MAKTYLPTREGALLAWTLNFNTKLSVSIDAPATYGLTTEQATIYNADFMNFQTTYNTANDPNTRSPVSIAAKNTAKKTLIDKTRELVDICQAWPMMTNAKRADLGITIRAEPSPVPVPSEAPVIDIVAVNGRTVKLRLHAADSTSRAKPAGVKGASVFSYIGETPPPSTTDWTFEQGVSTTDVTVNFPATVLPGTKVWFTAFWFNPRIESGPATPPVSTFIQYGGMSKAA